MTEWIQSPAVPRVTMVELFREPGEGLFLSRGSTVERSVLDSIAPVCIGRAPLPLYARGKVMGGGTSTLPLQKPRQLGTPLRSDSRNLVSDLNS